MDEPREWVQYFPCGCTAFLRETEIIELGAESQLVHIKSGEKFDAVILSTTLCESCNY